MSIKQSCNRDDVSADEDNEAALDCYTEDVRAKVDHFNRRASDITREIDNLVTAGIRVMEKVKQRFVSRMEEVKEELLSGVQSQNLEWEESSKKYQEDVDRLLSIKDLVRSLGIST